MSKLNPNHPQHSIELSSQIELAMDHCQWLKALQLTEQLSNQIRATLIQQTPLFNSLEITANQLSRGDQDKKYRLLTESIKGQGAR